MTKSYTLILRLISMLVFVSTPLLSGAASEPVNGAPGVYVREEKYDDESAQLKIKQLSNGKVHVTGIALWGRHNRDGPSTGDLDFVTTINSDKLKYLKKEGKGRIYKLELQFHGNGLTAREELTFAYFGAGVTFEGEYLKKYSSN